MTLAVGAALPGVRRRAGGGERGGDRLRAPGRPPRRPRPRRGGGAAPRPRPAALARPRGRVAAAAPLPRAGAGPDAVLQRRRPRAGRGGGRPAGADRGAAGGARWRGSGGEVRTGDRGGRRALRGRAPGRGADRRRRGAARRRPSCSPTAPGRAGPSGCPSTPARRCARSRARWSSCAAATAPPPCERIVASERVYLVPRADGRLIVGATVEEQGFDTAVTAGGVHELLREAYRLLPDVAEMELVDSMAGLRPGTPDNLPLIGPGAIEGLVLATGHYRNGILLAPLTADAIAATARRRPRRHRAAHPLAVDRRGPRPSVERVGRSGPRRRTARAPPSRAPSRGASRRGAAMRVELNGEPRELPDAATLADAVRESGAGEGARGVAVALDGEVVPRGEWERDAAARGPERRGARRDPGRRRDLGAGRPRVGLAADRRHRRLPLAGADGAGAERRRDRDRHRRPAPHRPRRRGLGARRDRPPRPLRPAQHRRLLHRPRRRPHRPPRPRGLPDRLGQARGDRRRPHPLPRRGRAARRRRDSSSPTASPSSPTPTTTRSSPAASRRPAAPR